MGTRRAVLAGLGVGVLLAGVRALAAVPDPNARPRRAPSTGLEPGLPVEQLFPTGQRAVPQPVRGELLNGSAFDLAALHGQVVVVNFWASWCGPCRDELAGLKAVYEATRGLGVTFLGVAVRDTRPAATALVAELALPYPSLFDPQARVALAFDQVSPVALPATVVLDRRGRMAAVFLRAVVPADLQPVVRQLAAEEEPTGLAASGRTRPAGTEESNALSYKRGSVKDP